MLQTPSQPLSYAIPDPPLRTSVIVLRWWAALEAVACASMVMAASWTLSGAFDWRLWLETSLQALACVLMLTAAITGANSILLSSATVLLLQGMFGAWAGFPWGGINHALFHLLHGYTALAAALLLARSRRLPLLRTHWVVAAVALMLVGIYSLVVQMPTFGQTSGQTAVQRICRGVYALAGTATGLVAIGIAFRSRPAARVALVGVVILDAMFLVLVSSGMEYRADGYVLSVELAGGLHDLANLSSWTLIAWLLVRHHQRSRGTEHEPGIG
jgi:hypothetical protein